MFRESGWLRSFWTKAILSAIIDAHHCDVLTLRAAAGLLKRKIAAIGGSAPPGTGTRAVTLETIAPSVASLRRRSGSAAGPPRMIVRIGELAKRPGCALLRRSGEPSMFFYFKLYSKQNEKPKLSMISKDDERRVVG